MLSFNGLVFITHTNIERKLLNLFIVQNADSKIFLNKKKKNAREESMLWKYCTINSLIICIYLS